MPPIATMQIERYLDASFHPDCEYIDRTLSRRTGGEWNHSRVQTLAAVLLGAHEQEWCVQGGIAPRVRVSPTRVRIPDLLLIANGAGQNVMTEPPLLAIEVISPEDTYSQVQERVSDYLTSGVRAVWIIDPETRSGRQCVNKVWTATALLRVPGTLIELLLNELFAELDKYPTLH